MFRYILLIMFVGSVACATPAPPLTSEEEALLAADAVARACEVECEGLELFIRDELVANNTLLGQERPMSDATQQALRQRLGQIDFIDRSEAIALFADGHSVDEDVALVVVGPVETLATNVIGFEVGITTRLVGGHGQVLQYQWSGDDWHAATTDETGVTVTSWVS